MTGTLGDLNPKSNSIGFIRITSALAVLVGHTFAAGGFLEHDPTLIATNNQAGIARTAVDVFFCLSGYLIAMSYMRTNSFGVFAWHRFLRIFPAFWVVIALTGFVIAPLLSGNIAWMYMLRSAPLVTGVGNYIPGLMDNAALDGINGSLWTLPWEVRAYIIIGVLGFLALIRLIPVVIIFLGAWAWLVVDILTADGIWDISAINSGVRLFTFFFAGTLFYVLRERIPMRWWLFVISITVLVLATYAGIWWMPRAGGIFYMVAPLPLTYAVFWLSLRLPGIFRRINTRIDLSYGVYIYGTLTLNVLAIVGLDQEFFTYLALDLVITFALAAASWFFVEKPAMSLKNARIVVSGGKRRFVRNGRPRPDPVGAGASTDR